jgi:phage regulator Rha-like protein
MSTRNTDSREPNVESGVIGRRIHVVRSQKVVLSTHLAELYGVKPKTLIQAVRRKASRFPSDFMFQLTKEEFDSLRSQIVTLEKGRGRYPKYPPFAFTEQGVAMLSSVLNSERAVQVNIAIMRAFVRLREILAIHKDLARRIEALERKHTDHDANIRMLFQTIREYLEAAPKKRRPIGFKLEP